MYKICKVEQSSSRQRELENGLLEVMQTHYYNDISVSDLCGHLHISRKAFYCYFANKEGALLALLDHTLEVCNRNIDPHSTMENALGQYFSFWKNRADLLNALARSNLIGKLVDRTYEFAMQERGFWARILRRYPTAEKSTIVMFLATGLMSILLNWQKNNFQPSVDQIVCTTVTLFNEPILSI